MNVATRISVMCGRYTLRAKLNTILAQLGYEASLEYAVRYNIAPTQQVPIVVGSQVRLALWGLIPSWATDEKIGNSLINARAETVADKPSFRAAFKRGRCLIVADGFYEWRREGKAKQPFLIHRPDDQPFTFAGLAEHWSKGEQPIDSCTIITTTANQLMSTIHDRMPVILPPTARALWLDPKFQGKDELLSLLRPYPDGELVATPVSTLVNNPRNDSPACAQPA